MHIFDKLPHLDSNRIRQILHLCFRHTHQFPPVVLHIQIHIPVFYYRPRHIHIVQTILVRRPMQTDRQMGYKSFHNFYHHNCQNIVEQRRDTRSWNPYHDDVQCNLGRYCRQTCCCKMKCNRNINCCLILICLDLIRLFVRQPIPALRWSLR